MLLFKIIISKNYKSYFPYFLHYNTPDCMFLDCVESMRYLPLLITNTAIINGTNLISTLSIKHALASQKKHRKILSF